MPSRPNTQPWGIPRPRILEALLLLILLPVAAQATEPNLCTIALNKTIQVNDTPFFPIGIYYNARELSDTQKAADLASIAAAGFNLIETSQIMAWTAPGDFLDAAHAAHIRVACEVPFDDDASVDVFVNQWKSKPAIIAWNVADDSHRKFSIEQVQAMNTRAKQLSPTHLTYQTVYQWQNMGPYMPLTDMVWAYRYPVYNNPNLTITRTVDLIMDEARAYNTCVLGIPQAYRWEDFPDDRFPSPLEYRTMTYQYLVNGAKGIVPYSFTDSGRLPDVAPALWAEMAAVNAELAALAPAILGGVYSRAVTTNAEGHVPHGIYAYDGGHVVMLTNARDAAKFTVLTLPPGVSGVLSPLFPGRPQGLVWDSATLTLSGTVEAGESHVYRIEPPLSAVETWRRTYFGVRMPSGSTADTATPAGDGVPNLLKYAFNMMGNGVGQASTPNTPNPAILAPSGTAGLPKIGVDGTGKLQLTYIRRKPASAPGITYTVEFSDALSTWAVKPSASESVTSIDATFERVTVTDSVSSAAKRFARVRITSL